MRPASRRPYRGSPDAVPPDAAERQPARSGGICREVRQRLPRLAHRASARAPARSTASRPASLPGTGVPAQHHYPVPGTDPARGTAPCRGPSGVRRGRRRRGRRTGDRRLPDAAAGQQPAGIPGEPAEPWRAGRARPRPATDPRRAETDPAPPVAATADAGAPARPRDHVSGPQRGRGDRGRATTCRASPRPARSPIRRTPPVAIVRVAEAPVRPAALHANPDLDVVNVAVAVAGAACGGQSYPVRVVPAQDGPAAGQLEAVDVASIPVANASPYRPVSFSDSMRPGMRHSTGSTWSSSGMWQRRFVPDAPGQSQRRNHPEQDLISPRGGDF